MQDRLPDLDGPEDVCVDWNVLSGFLNSNAVKTCDLQAFSQAESLLSATPRVMSSTHEAHGLRMMLQVDIFYDDHFAWW